MFLHAREGHVKPLGEGRDRSVRTPELLQNAASGGIRERAERGIEVALEILNHVVQYIGWRDGTQWGGEDGWEIAKTQPLKRRARLAAGVVSRSA